MHTDEVKKKKLSPILRKEKTMILWLMGKKNFLDQPVNNEKWIYDNIWKTTNGQGDY